MNWIKTVIYTTAKGIEPVVGRLCSIGIEGTQIEDEQDFLDFLKNNTQFWDLVDEDLMAQKKGETRVIFYLADDGRAKARIDEVRAQLEALKAFDKEGGFGRLSISTSKTDEEDWANNWKQYFKPTKVGQSILICPEWEPVPQTERTVFRINPGMSFGTGTHHSTRLCIEELEQCITPGCQMLDLGCGSGILSIISLLLGASHATAADIDPNAVHIAYQNAALNGIGQERYTVLAGNILSDDALIKTIGEIKYDVIAANIIADVIIALAPIAANLIKPAGVFLSSGIILPRLDEVETALKPFFVIESIQTSADWACIRSRPRK